MRKQVKSNIKLALFASYKYNGLIPQFTRGNKDHEFHISVKENPVWLALSKYKSLESWHPLYTSCVLWCVSLLGVLNIFFAC